MTDKNTTRAYDALIEKLDNRLAAIREKAVKLVDTWQPDLRERLEEHLEQGPPYEAVDTTYVVNANMLIGILRLALREANEK